MRKVTQLLLLSCSIIATDAHAGSLSEDDGSSLKRSIAQNSAAKRIRRSEDESEATQGNVRVKIEPLQQSTLPQLLSPADIEQTLPHFNPGKGEKNCLACNTKFVKWALTRIFEPAKEQDLQGHNIAIYDHCAVLLDEQNASDLPYTARIIEISDHLFQEYIGIDVTQLILLPKKIRDLDAFFQSLPLTKVANGSHKAGLMYLDYKGMPEPKNVGEITGHYLGFYIYEPQGQPRQTFVVDAQPAKMWPLNQFLEKANAYYADCAYIWWPQDEGNGSSPLPSIKKEKSESDGEEVPAAADVETPSTRVQSAQYLLQALNSQDLPQDLKDGAAFKLASMRYKNNTSAITDDQAALYFQQALNSQHLTQGLKEGSAYQSRFKRFSCQYTGVDAR